MKIVIPKDIFSSKEREIIQSEYNNFLSELGNSKKVNEFVNSRIRYTEEFLEFQNKCIFALKFTSFNVIVAILSLTICKSFDWYLFLLFIWPLFFVPTLYFELIDFLLKKIFHKKIEQYNEEKSNLTRLYEKNVYEKYEKYVKMYEEMTEHDNKVKRIKNDFKQSILERVYSLDNNEFRDTIIMLYSNDYVIKKSKMKDCLEVNNGDYKFLIMYKKLKRSISIVEVKKFEEYINKNNFDYGLLYYIGDISTPAVKYCSRNLRKKIYLYNHYDLCNSIYEYKINNSTIIISK